MTRLIVGFPTGRASFRCDSLPTAQLPTRLRAGIEPPAHVMSYGGSRAQRQKERAEVGMASLEPNKAIVRRYYHELWNAWNVDLANELISLDVSFLGSLGV